MSKYSVDLGFPHIVDSGKRSTGFTSEGKGRLVFRKQSRINGSWLVDDKAWFVSHFFVGIISRSAWDVTWHGIMQWKACWMLDWLCWEDPRACRYSFNSQASHFSRILTLKCRNNRINLGQFILYKATRLQFESVVAMTRFEKTTAKLKNWRTLFNAILYEHTVQRIVINTYIKTASLPCSLSFTSSIDKALRSLSALDTVVSAV